MVAYLFKKVICFAFARWAVVSLARWVCHYRYPPVRHRSGTKCVRAYVRTYVRTYVLARVRSTVLVHVLESVVCDRACRAQLLKFWSKVML